MSHSRHSITAKFVVAVILWCSHFGASAAPASGHANFVPSQARANLRPVYDPYGNKIPDDDDVSDLNPAFILTGAQVEKATAKGLHEAQRRIGATDMDNRWYRYPHDVQRKTHKELRVRLNSVNGLDFEMNGYYYSLEGDNVGSLFARIGPPPDVQKSILARGTASQTLSFTIQTSGNWKYFLTDDWGDKLLPASVQTGNSPIVGGDAGSFADVSFGLFDRTGKPQISRRAMSITLHIVSHERELLVYYKLWPPKI